MLHLERSQDTVRNIHSADEWKLLLLPEIERPRKLEQETRFRADAASAKREVCAALEEHGAKYTIRIPANALKFTR